MSEVERKVSDLSVDEKALVQKYVEDGMPGLDKISPETLSRSLELYLEGKTYYQISRVTRAPKVLIMYLSWKFDWHTAKLEQLAELEHMLYERTLTSRVRAQDFLLQIQHAYQKRIGNKINSYLNTGNEAFMDTINPKEVSHIFKTIEAIDKLVQDKLPKRPAKGAMVGINPGEAGVTVRQIGENEIEVTPKTSAMSNKLQEMAAIRREEEAKKKEEKK